MARRRELDYMNGAACLLVILIHVLSLGISSADPRSWQAAVIYLPWRLASFVVPMFLYTGAVKLVLKFGDTPITPGLWLRYFGQRLRKIYLPYVLWVVIYYACFLPIHYVLGTPEEFFSYLLLGTLSAPFYYIIIVMQFYFLMPLWMWVVRRLPAYLSLGLSLLVMFVMQQFSYLLSLGGIDFPYADRIFPTYLLYWVAGLYVGRHYDRAVRTLDRPAGQGLCLAGAVLCALLAYVQYASGAYLFNLNDIKLAGDLLSIAAVHFLSLKLTRSPDRLQVWLERLQRSSFFVYLSHCLFLTLATAYLQGLGVNRLSLLLAARLLVCYTVPFLLYALYQRTFGRCRPLRGLLG